MILFLIYLAGYLWFWRYHIGFIYSLDNYELEVSDVIFGAFMGSWINLLWPLTVTGRMFYVLHSKYGPESINPSGFFPQPKKIESREEKRNRLEQEAKRKRYDRQNAINDRERELGMKLTKWEDAEPRTTYHRY